MNTATIHPEIEVAEHGALRSLKQLYGEKLMASDGEIGRIEDFYFDDHKWAVRYVIVDTGESMAVRQVLISPYAFGAFYEEGRSLMVNLTRKQIENSPPIEAHKPISRQYEDDYYRYYGWPSYNDGLELWGGAGFPVVPPPEYARSSTEHGVSHVENCDDSHLRSTRNVRGYHIQTAEGEIGHVTDFMIDDKSWAIRRLVVETGSWFHGKEIVFSPTHIDRISYEKSKVFVSVSKDVIRDAVEYQMPRAAYRGVHE